jgi:hypothetical protein
MNPTTTTCVGCQRLSGPSQSNDRSATRNSVEAVGPAGRCPVRTAQRRMLTTGEHREVCGSRAASRRESGTLRVPERLRP